MIHKILFITLFLFSMTAMSQQQNDLRNSVQLNATYSKVDKTITLNWENYPQATSYEIYQRSIGSPSWGSIITSIEGDTSYTFSNIDIGDLREYRIRRIATDGNTEGYAYSGIEYQKVRFGSKSIVIIESEIKDSLSMELDRYNADLENEGWEVTEVIVNKDDTAAEVKEAIVDVYNSDPFRYKMITIIGHVPVPYSGNIGPDGHSNHIGAWPCDGYYADPNGNWTDVSTTNTTAAQSRNHNIPADGKWDQSIFPSELEMSIGRIDFSNLPLFEETEIELTKRYLDKNHAYRTGVIKSVNRGIVENNFNLAEGFGQNGYRNIGALVGRDSTFSRDFDVLKSDTYLWSYGAGGGNFQGASGISNTTNFTQDSIQSIFTMLFGSYFGDFDSNNNFLRASLATGTVLSTVWAGRPNWHFHPMGMGATLGDCTRLSMNNTSYVGGFGNRQVHMALIGDPSLKMTYVLPPNDINISQEGNHIELNWSASMDSQISGYHIYRAIDSETPQLIDTIVSGTNFTDLCVDQSNYTYYISAVRLEEGITGSYFNESPHVSVGILISETNNPIADYTYAEDSQTVSFQSTASNALNHDWDFGDGNTSNEVNPIHTYDNFGIYDVTLTVEDADNCYSDTYTEEINLMPNSIFEHQIENKIYPNPTQELLYLTSFETIKKILVMDIFGRHIETQLYNAKNVSLHTTHYAPGTYFLQITMENGKDYQSKFVKL